MGNPAKEQEALSEAPPRAYSHSSSEMIPPHERPRVAHIDDAQQLVPATAKLPPFLTQIHSLSLSSLHLGTHNKDKRYHVKQSSKEIVLRDGPTKSDTVLAQVTSLEQGTAYGKSVIHVPRPHGEEPLSLVMPGDHSNRQPFSLRVGKENRLEHFEWRQSQGNEVEEVGQTKWHGYGWKLVRLTADDDVAGRGGRRESRDFGFTSDGREIVAACAYTNRFWRGPDFSFLGTGLTGTLGEEFEIVAVVTFLRIMFLQAMRAAQSGAPWWYNKEPHPGLVAEAGPPGNK